MKQIIKKAPKMSLVKKIVPGIFAGLFYCSVLSAQNPTPAGPQTKNILLFGGTAHIGNGEVIPNSVIAFKEGKFYMVADGSSMKINPAAYDTIIYADGKHIYPGLIGMNTHLGLNEIEAVRATNDIQETGEYNPSIRSIIAYNTDSKVIPTVRSNGVLLAEVAPGGGTISGRSSVVQLDAWNWEDAVVKIDIGIHMRWPNMRVRSGNKSKPAEEQEKQIANSLQQLHDYFSNAAGYSKNKNPQTINQNFEAMRGLFNGSTKLFVHCNYVKEIVAAIDLCRKFHIQMVLVGGLDAVLVTDLLKANNIPIVVENIHRLPAYDDDAVDKPYTLPARLQQDSLFYAIAVPEFWQVRNLAFQAGTAAAYGITKEQAIAAITSAPATILGIADRTGTLEYGKDATLIVVSGDLLDMKSSQVEMAWIAGRMINLDNVQKQLNEKYRKKYGISASGK